MWELQHISCTLHKEVCRGWKLWPGRWTYRSVICFLTTWPCYSASYTSERSHACQSTRAIYEPEIAHFADLLCYRLSINQIDITTADRNPCYSDGSGGVFSSSRLGPVLGVAVRNFVRVLLSCSNDAGVKLWHARVPSLHSSRSKASRISWIYHALYLLPSYSSALFLPFLLLYPLNTYLQQREEYLLQRNKLFIFSSPTSPLVRLSNKTTLYTPTQ